MKDGALVTIREPRPRHEGAAKVLAVIVLAILVLSSLMLLIPSSGAKGSPKAPDASPGQTGNAVLTKSGAHAWDWKALADQSGYAHVILWDDSSASPQDLVGRMAFKLGGTNPGTARSVLSAADIQIKSIFEHGFKGISVKIRPSVLEQVLASDSTIHAYPDLQVQALDIQSDQQIGADQIWTQKDSLGSPVTGTGVTVAVIDTGIDYLHPDLGGGFGPGYKVVGGYDFFNNDSNPIDDNGHGTHVAGIIAASGGIEGVAPGASLLAYKVLGADGSGPMSDVIEAIDASIDPNHDGSPADHVNVISMSLGGSGDSQDPICQAVKRAVDAGIVVVVAAGNSGPSVGTVASPGVSPYAVTVGAVDSSGSLANFSSRGPTADMLMKPDVSAPGVNILSTVPYSGTPHSDSSGYMTMSGTSMATPHVSGAAALLVQMHPEWTPLQVKSALVTGAKSIGESFWSAGSGEIWLPTSMDTSLFSSEPLVSYGIASGTSHGLSVSNSEQTATFSVRSADWYSLSADGSNNYHQWSNISAASPQSLSISSGMSGSLSLSVSALPASSEGYYDGTITLSSGSTIVRIPFGFMILTKVTVHVNDPSGKEVFDPYGGVWIYSIPGAEVGISRRGSDEPAPPATFLLPSGQYSVHAAGHQLIYNYGDPYLLSKVFTLARLETRDVWLNMTDAHKVSINLETSEGNPIYVKEFRLYARYTGANNYSFDLTGCDYSIMGSEVFTIPHSTYIYVSDTQAAVGISIQGFAYSSGMWDFMKLNWQHWYEYIAGTSTSFITEATADLQYLLAWEFPHVDSSMPSVLTYDLNSSSVYVTKYDIPGTIVDPWLDWGTHRAIGGESAFYVRRDTDTSLNPFFSGMTRTTIVSGIFSELYFPRGIFSGYFEREFYTPDYSHVVKARTASSVFLPDRNFLTPSPVVHEDQRLGVGPFYPSIFTLNTNDTMVMFNPLLRDQWGSKIGGMNGPMMHLYLGGFMIGTYQLSEFLARPDAERIVPLTGGSGNYVAKIDYSPFSELSNNVEIDLGFSVPSSDPDPPVITGLTMPQKFVPGAQLGLSVSAEDRQSDVSVQIMSRAGAGASWVSLPVHSTTPTDFTSVIQTSIGDSVVDLMVIVSDSQGNYVNYTAYSVAQGETPVLFDIHPSINQVEYKSTGVTVGLTGYLTDLSGNPLDASAGVPLELTVAGRKVGMILDEYVSGTTHQHNGSIRFDWTLRPTEIFSSANQTVEVNVSFDLGTYSSITRTFLLKSIPDTNSPPVIRLNSPANGSLMASGSPIDLSIADDGIIVSSGYSVDGSQYKSLSSPWNISTSGWSDGNHVISVYAEDDDGANVTLQISLEVDSTAPSLTIASPLNGSLTPLGSSLVVQVSDAHLSEVSYSVDGGSAVGLPAPYTVDLSSWSLGWHTVDVIAADAVGHTSAAHTGFEIANSTVVVSLVSPADGSVIKSGVPIELTVLGSGALRCSWSELGVSHALSSPYEISTSGWAEGIHQIAVVASNDIGGHYQTVFSLTVDDTPPSIVSVSPANGYTVTSRSLVIISASDPHFRSISWTLAGGSASSTASTVIISLNRIHTDGYFTISVVVSDLANNTLEQQFMYAMDFSAPVVRFNGASNGSAIQPGASLNLTASDMFLSGVWLSLDGGDWQSVSVPHEIDTSHLALGWHTLDAIAEDFARHNTTESISIYVDGTPPVVAMVSGTSFVANSSFTVRASPWDDFDVHTATLFYSLSGGGFGSMPMTKVGSVFTATLAPDQLWDGMTVYVVVSDTVEHSVESEHQTLLASASVPAGDNPDNSGGMTAQVSWMFTSGGMGSMLIVVISALILLFFVYRRRDSEDDFADEEPAPENKPVRMSAASLIEAAHRSAVASPSKVQPSYAQLGAVQAVAVRAPPARRDVASAQEPERNAFSVLDSIPALHTRPDEISDEGYESFMAGLEGLQQDLAEALRKRSVYQEPDLQSSLELQKELDLDLEKPSIIRGLRLRSMMR